MDTHERKKGLPFLQGTFSCVLYYRKVRSFTTAVLHMHIKHKLMMRVLHFLNTFFHLHFTLFANLLIKLLIVWSATSIIIAACICCSNPLVTVRAKFKCPSLCNRACLEIFCPTLLRYNWSAACKTNMEWNKWKGSIPSPDYPLLCTNFIKCRCEWQYARQRVNLQASLATCQCANVVTKPASHQT